MKIKEIKSKEVRERAIEYTISSFSGIVPMTEDKAMDKEILYGFKWVKTPEPFFWAELDNGIITNTEDLKLPKSEQNENQ